MTLHDELKQQLIDLLMNYELRIKDAKPLGETYLDKTLSTIASHLHERPLDASLYTARKLRAMNGIEGYNYATKEFKQLLEKG